jgi:hypothetical protein
MQWGSWARALERAICISVLLSGMACDDDAKGGAPKPRDSGSDTDSADAASSDPAADGGEPSHVSWLPPVVKYPDAKSTEAFRLSQTGLYRDLASKELAPDLIEYEPEYKLWSDGAEKRRWLRLPPGTAIDSSDMDHWVFPVGTMFFKEFSLAGKRLETRLVARLGPKPDDYFMGAFVWNEDETDAVFEREGESNVRGTEHDVPETKRCFTCHNGDEGRALGYSAVQQPAAKALLSDPPSEPYVVPGDDVARQALGYLHANCGNCHNPSGTSRTDTNLTLRLEVSEHTVEDTGIYKSSVRVELDHWMHKAFDLRIAPGDSGASAVSARMKSRTKDDAMPPFASELVDETGVELVEKWIDSLPKAAD